MIARRNKKNQDEDFLIPEENDDISFSNISSPAKNTSDNNDNTTANSTTATAPSSSSSSTVSDYTTDTVSNADNTDNDSTASTDDTTSTDTDKAAADADKSTTDDSTDNTETILDENGDIAYVDTGSIAKAKKNKRKQRLFIIIVSVILVILLVFLVLVKVNHKGIIKGNQYASTTNTANTDSNSNDSSSGDDATKTYLENTLGVPEYYSQARSKTIKDDKLKAQADADAVAGAPANSHAALMSKESDPDFTDDPTKAYNDDGTLNTHYSYLSAEYVDETIRDDIERLVNPVYGEWTGTQNASGIDYTKGNGGEAGNENEWTGLLDMFTDDYKDKIQTANLMNENVGDTLPIYADWKKDSFGGQWNTRDEINPIVGSVGLYDCKYYIQSVQGDYITCTVPVKYTANTTDGIKSINKVMNITYSVNYSSTDGRRILIDEIQQN